MEVTLDLTDGVGCIRMDDGKKNAITPAAYAGNELALRARALEVMGRDLAS